MRRRDSRIRVARLWPALGLLALLLSSCTGIPLPALPFLQPDATPTPPPRPLRLLLPQEGPLTDALTAQAQEWATAAGGQVEVDSPPDYASALAEQLESGQPPDLFVVSSFDFPGLAADGQLAPRPNADPPALADFPPQLATAFQWQGQQFCRPREVRTLALVYDAAALAAAGEAPPADWDALHRVAEEQTDLNTGRFGFIEAPDLSRWLPFLFAAGGTLIDDSGQIALQSPAGAAALDFYILLFRENIAGHPGESNSAWAGEVLGKGKGGLALEGNWIAPYFAQEFPDFAYGVAPLPTGPAGSNRSIGFSSCYAVAADSQRAAEAFALADFLTSPAVVAALPNDGGWMPADPTLRQAWQQEFPHLAPFAHAVEQAWVWQLPPGGELFLRSFNRGLVQLFAADMEAADFLAEMQRVGAQVFGQDE